jgi:hypothetical protein
MDTLFESTPPLTDGMEFEEPDVEPSFSRSPRPLTPSIALDGPWAEDIGLMMEPDGAIVLQGGHISAFNFSTDYRQTMRKGA